MYQTSTLVYKMYSYRKVFNHHFLANVLILQPELVVRSRENIYSPMPGITYTRNIYVMIRDQATFGNVASYSFYLRNL